MIHYHSGRRLAIAAGAAATGGALAILLADPVTSGTWRLDHGLLPIIVAVTIAAGHLVGLALRAGKLLSALGFAGVFALGTMLTVYSSVGSQKASVGDKALTVEAHNGAIAQKRADLAEARLRRRQADAMADREMTSETCGRRCQDWRKRATEVQSHIAILEVQLAGLGGEKVARPRAEAFATAAAVFGFDRRRVEAAATVLEPFAYSLLLELAAIVAFGYGFAGNRCRARASATRRQPPPSVPVRCHHAGGGRGRHHAHRRSGRAPSVAGSASPTLGRAQGNGLEVAHRLRASSHCHPCRQGAREAGRCSPAARRRVRSKPFQSHRATRRIRTYLLLCRTDRLIPTGPSMQCGPACLTTESAGAVSRRWDQPWCRREGYGRS